MILCFIDKFITNSKNWSTELQSKDSKAKLIGSWKVEVGDQDQYGMWTGKSWGSVDSEFL